MRDHLSWRTVHSYQKVLYSNATEPVTKDHLSWDTTSLWANGVVFQDKPYCIENTSSTCSTMRMSQDTRSKHRLCILAEVVKCTDLLSRILSHTAQNFNIQVFKHNVKCSLGFNILNLFMRGGGLGLSHKISINIYGWFMNHQNLTRLNFLIH